LLVRKIFFILLLCLSPVFLEAQGNPFTGTPSSEIRSTPLPLLPLPPEFREFQRSLHQTMVDFLRDSQENSALLFAFFIITIIYGVFHSLLPGHQKALVVAYFLSRQAPLRQALWTGLLLAFAHLMSSLGLYLGMWLVRTLSENFTSLNEASEVVARVFQTLSLVGVLVLALFLIKESWESILQRLQQKGLMEVAQLMNIPHQEDEHWNRQSQKNLMGILFLASVVPCPGTLLVLVFSFSLQAHALGILAALGISLGVGLVLGLISLFTILAQRQGKKLIKQGSLETLAALVQMGAALLLTLTSLTLLT